MTRKEQIEQASVEYQMSTRPEFRDEFVKWIELLKIRIKTK